MQSKENLDSIKEFLNQSNIDYVKVAITDIDGVLRGKYMHKDKFLKACESGFGFCDVIFGWDSNDDLYELENLWYEPLTGWHSGFPDAKVKIILDSKRSIPFENNVPLFLAQLDQEEVCPRGLLEKVLNRLTQNNLKAKASLEYEFFLFNEDPHTVRKKKFQNLSSFTPGMFGYSILRSSVHSKLYEDILNMCLEMDMKLEGLHTETGPGVLEAAIEVDEAMLAADKASIFKTFMKVLAQRNNLMATFMAKWSNKYPGQSGHIHCSLVNQSNEPIFGSKEQGPSEIMNHFLGGLQRYLPEFTLMLAPTINSYKRLTPGAWAPTSFTWGKENRTTGIRAILGSSFSQRIENRVGGADSNPYLALAATLGAGILGIENKITPLDEFKGNAYEAKINKTLQTPKSLGEATDIFKNSEAAKKVFGTQFVNHFSMSRDWENSQFENQRKLFERNSLEISEWELKRYFEII